MMRLAALLLLVGIVVGIGGLATTTGSASAAAVDLSCQNGPVVDGVGTVNCTLSVTDLPTPLTDFSLSLEATYNDNDGDGAPSPGDRLKCIAITGSGPMGGSIDVSFCR